MPNWKQSRLHSIVVAWQASNCLSFPLLQATSQYSVHPTCSFSFTDTMIPVRVWTSVLICARIQQLTVLFCSTPATVMSVTFMCFVWQSHKFPWQLFFLKVCQWLNVLKYKNYFVCSVWMVFNSLSTPWKPEVYLGLPYRCLCVVWTNSAECCLAAFKLRANA